MKYFNFVSSSTFEMRGPCQKQEILDHGKGKKYDSNILHCDLFLLDLLRNRKANTFRSMRSVDFKS